MNTPTQMPPYLEHAGFQMFRQPYAMHGASLRSHVLSGQRDKIQALVDTYLNACLAADPPDGEVTFRALSGHVLLSALYVDEMTSARGPDSSHGSMSQTEVSIWTLVAKMKKHLGLWIPERIGWFTPYLFLDNALALVAGREVYGFPKAFGRVQPSKPDGPGPLTVETIFPKEFSPGARWEMRQLLELSGRENSVRGESFSDVDEGRQKLLGRLFGDRDHKIQIPELDLIVDLLGHLHLDTSSLFFVKQFRDAKDPGKACYQKLIEAPLRITSLHAGGFLEGEHTLQITPNPAYNLIDDLGLKPSQKVDFGVYMDLDIEFGLAEGED